MYKQSETSFVVNKRVFLETERLVGSLETSNVF